MRSLIEMRISSQCSGQCKELVKVRMKAVRHVEVGAMFFAELWVDAPKGGHKISVANCAGQQYLQ